MHRRVHPASPENWSDLHPRRLLHMVGRSTWVALAVIAVIAAGAMLAPSRASAQGTTGSISGFVTDDTAAALPGATVTVRDIETDQKRVLVTDAAGRYRAQQLAPGKYEVIVEL